MLTKLSICGIPKLRHFNSKDSMPGGAITNKNFEAAAINADCLDQDDLLTAHRIANIAVANTLLGETFENPYAKYMLDRYNEASENLGNELSRRQIVREQTAAHGYVEGSYPLSRITSFLHHILHI